MKLECEESDERLLTCSFTGYRPSKLPFRITHNSEEYRKLRETLEKEIRLMINNGVKFFLTGMAQGIDMICGEIILELKKEFDIYLFCIIPCKNHHIGLNNKSLEVYNKLISAATGIIYTSEEEYSKGCMTKRNRYLVDNAEYILAVFDGQKGGTMSTINYAKKKKKTITIINPNDYTKVELIHGEDKGVLYV